MSGMIPCRNPKLCGVQNHRASTTDLKCHAAPSSGASLSSLQHVVRLQNGSRPAPVDTMRTPEIERYLELDREMEELSSGTFGPYLNYFKIKKLKSEMYELDSVREVAKLIRDDEEFHLQHPNAPEWAHSGAADGDGSKDMDWLYAQKRNFDVVMGEDVEFSPDHNRVVSGLNHQNLTPQEAYAISHYATNFTSRADRDYDAENYRKWVWEQSRVDVALSKAPRLDEPAVVWRGENFNIAGASSLQSAEAMKRRVQMLINLKPGNKFSWMNGISTSTSISAAAGGYSRTVGSSSEPITIPTESNPDHAFVFEMETDRGICINSSLNKQSDEHEVLIPGGLKYEVLGHVQVRRNYKGSGTNGSDEFYHVIKLRLIS